MNYLLGLFCLAVANALHEDQIGLFDWKQEYIGTAKLVLHVDKYPKVIFVASELNTFAAVSLVDSHIMWRKVLPHDERIHMLAGVGKSVVAASSTEVFSFDFKGNLKWNVGFTDPINAVTVHDVEDDTLLFMTDKAACTINERGDLKCGALPNSSSLTYYSGFVTSDGAFAIIGGDTAGSNVIQMGSSNDRLKFSEYATVKSTGKLFCSSGSKPYGVICVAEHSPTNFLLINSDKTVISKEAKFPVSQVSSVKTVDGATYVQFSSVTCKITDSSIVSCNGPSFVELSSVGLVTATIASDSISVYLPDNPDEAVAQFKLDKVSEEGYLKFYPVISKRKDGSLLIQGLLQLKSSALVFLHDGDVMWVREESLSDIAAVLAVDFPLSHMEGNIEKEFDISKLNFVSMFVKRMRTEIESTVEYLQEAYIRYLAPIPGTARNDLLRDTFSLNKFLVIVTASSKIHSMESRTGEILWTATPKCQFYDSDQISTHELRNTDHYGSSALVAVVGPSSESTWCMVVVDVVAGKVIEEVTLPVIVLVELFPFEMEDHQKPLLLIDASLRVTVYPTSALSFVTNRAERFALHTYLPRTVESGVTGYKITASAGQLKLTDTWNMDFPDRQLHSLNAKPVGEVVHSKGNVLADRTVLYKYLNPSLLAVVTTGEDAGKEIVDVSFVDGISGRVLDTSQLRHATSPIHVVHAENWVVMSSWNSNYRRTEVTVWEMFEGKEEWNSTTFSSYWNLNKEPFIMKQSYVLNGNVVALTTSKTSRGITLKSVLFTLSTGHIVSIPKAWLNPRRVLEPPRELMEEGVLRYHPELQIIDIFKLNYNNTAIISKLITIPTNLESTSLVFAYGLDLYASRVAPSQMFDVLKEDFDYFLIALISVGMCVGTVVLKKIVDKREFNKAWA